MMSWPVASAAIFLIGIACGAVLREAFYVRAERLRLRAHLNSPEAIKKEIARNFENFPPSIDVAQAFQEQQRIAMQAAHAPTLGPFRKCDCGSGGPQHKPSCASLPDSK